MGCAEPKREKVTNDRFLDGVPGNMVKSLIEISILERKDNFFQF